MITGKSGAAWELRSPDLLITSETLQSATSPETLTSSTLSIADVSTYVSDLTKLDRFGANRSDRARVRKELRETRNIYAGINQWRDLFKSWAASYASTDLRGDLHPTTKYGTALTMRLANIERQSNRKAQS
jgi:hypothetical protein